MPNRTPKIVRDLFVTGQVGAIPPTSLFTPAADNMYRISAYVDAASVGSGQAILYDILWRDDNASQFASFGISGSSTNAHDQFLQTMRVKSGNAISIQPGANFNDSSDTYNLYVVVEEL